MTACGAIAELHVSAHERLVCLAAPWFSELASGIALLVAVVGIVWVLGRRYYLDARADGRARPRWRCATRRPARRRSTPTRSASAPAC